MFPDFEHRTFLDTSILLLNNDLSFDLLLNNVKLGHNVKYKRTDELSLWHQQINRGTTVDIHGPLQTRGETRCPGGVSVSCLAITFQPE